jgi:hypothetical protein
MMGRVWKFMTAFLAVTALGEGVRGQEAVLEEIVVEAPFDLRLELPRESTVQIMIGRLLLRAEAQRALEMQIANRNGFSTVLDLTKYSPIPLGGSESRGDTFFLQNSLRADLNPRASDVLGLGR